MAHRDFTLRVDAGPDPGGKAVPLRFYLGPRRVEVAAVLDRWLGAERSYFKVRGDDGDVYILLHETAEECWELTLFASASTPATLSC